MKKSYLIVMVLFLLPFTVLSQKKQPRDVLNPDFIEYLEQKRNGTTPEGFIPLTFLPDFTYLLENKSKKTLKSLPLTFDLRDEGDGGWVSPVKDQGNRGACWEFAGIGAIESFWMMQGYGEQDLSELNMGTCHGFEWGIDDGGNMYLTTAYLSRLAGPLLETQDPYNKDLFDAENPPDISCLSITYNPVAYVPEARWLPNDETLIKETIMEHGAVAGNMHQSEGLYDYLSSSDHTFYYNGTEKPNHAILVVGWDDTKVITGGTESPDVSAGAWIVKNSFGTSVLDQGYFYISYSDTRIFSEAYYFPRRQEYNEADKLYMYDKLGMIQPYIGNQTKTAYGLVKYTATEEQLVTQVGTYISSAGTFIDIEIYGDKTGDDLTNLLGKIERQICEYPGYHTFDVPAMVNGDFYVKVKYYTDQLRLPLLPIENRIEDFAHPDIESGVCWISMDGTSWDAVGSDVSGKEMDLCIRAYAKATTKPQAFFATQHTEICNENTIAITDYSINNPDTYHWDFGEGSSPAEANTSGPFSVTFNGTGEKTITLTVSGNDGSDSFSKKVNVVTDLTVKAYSADTILVNGRSTEFTVFADADEFSWDPNFQLNTTEGHTVSASPFVLPGQTNITYAYWGIAKQGDCETNDKINIKVVIAPDNDDVCNAIALTYGETQNYTNINSTVQQNEPHPDTTGVNSCMEDMKWCNEYGGQSLHNSVWFKFVADNSGVVSIDTRGMDNQIAVYEAETCDDILIDGKQTLLAAFDDFHIADFSGAAAILELNGLTEGKTYWVQVDGSGSGLSGNFSLLLSNDVMGIEKIDKESLFEIMPNPSNGIFRLIFDNSFSSDVQIEIFDTNGKKVFVQSFENKENTIDLTNLSKGIYFVKAFNNQVATVRKLIIE